MRRRATAASAVAAMRIRTSVRAVLIMIGGRSAEAVALLDDTTA
jgi:hypothetical protein